MVNIIPNYKRMRWIEILIHYFFHHHIWQKHVFWRLSVYSKLLFMSFSDIHRFIFLPFLLSIVSFYGDEKILENEVGSFSDMFLCCIAWNLGLQCVFRIIRIWCRHVFWTKSVLSKCIRRYLWWRFDS